LAVPLPATFAGYRLDAQWTIFKREEMLAKKPFLPSGLKITDAVDARYEEVRPAKGVSLTRSIVLHGYSIALSPADEKAVVDEMLDNFLQGDRASSELAAEPGSHGGTARCVGLIFANSESGACAWADNGTAGRLVGANYTAEQLKVFVPVFREALEK
jgi:hypothetical protein